MRAEDHPHRTEDHGKLGHAQQREAKAIPKECSEEPQRRDVREAVAEIIRPVAVHELGEVQRVAGVDVGIEEARRVVRVRDQERGEKRQADERGERDGIAARQHGAKLLHYGRAHAASGALRAMQIA